MKFVLCMIAAASLAAAQDKIETLTLADAEALAIAIHPALAAANTDAEAARTQVDQASAARRPQAAANMTAVGADHESRIAAGALNNPVLYSRVGVGLTMSQNIFDFGRSAHLVKSAQAEAGASHQRAVLTRADVILGVRRAYFQALRAEKIRRVASATVEARQLMVDQVRELVRAQLKTSLDESFAETNLSEAKLLVESAENDRQAAYAELAQAIGRPMPSSVNLVDLEDADGASPDLASLRQQAVERRADLASLRLELASARELSLAQRSARLPSVAGLLTMGVVPAGGPRLSTEYAAVGINLTLPVLTGGYQKAKVAEAELRARSAEQRLTELQNLIVRDVTTAWLQVNTAGRRITLTKQFVDRAALALELAQTRYDLGLSTIVELSQAQLTKTNAELQNAGAKYDYLLWKSVLEYRTGGL